jgi:hypothetical protein
MKELDPTQSVRVQSGIARYTLVEANVGSGG